MNRTADGVDLLVSFGGYLYRRTLTEDSGRLCPAVVARGRDSRLLRYAAT
jgi:hypothetical protein